MNITFQVIKFENLIRRFRFCVSFVLILLSGLTVTAQSHFPNIEAFLKMTLQNEDRLDFEAKGDLNSDGHSDWTGVVQRQKSSSETTSQLYVLLRLPKGGYRVAEKSLETEIGGSGCCYVEDLEISKGSLFIQNNFKSGAGIDAVTHRFKLYHGEWRLVGLKIYEAKPGSEVSIETELNLLTGVVIKKTQKGENKPLIKSRRQKITKHFLKDFNFSREPFFSN